VTRFPAFATSFIGRQRELERLRARTSAGERLVTILGPAGVGKTRLALHFAESLAFECPHLFCDVVDVKTVESACAALAVTLDVPLDVADVTASIDQLGSALASRGAVVVVLDNFDDLVASSAHAIAKWHVAAPRAIFVVTSRERLRLPAECCFELAPLDVPDARETDPEKIGASDAVHLFVARAALARADFVLSPSEAPAAAAIVRALDGMPLAIELCAVRASMLSVAQLEELLPRQLDTLGQGPRTTSSRHATLRRAIDASWNALSPPERDALAACSVFHGGWTLDAAENVVGAGALDRLQALHDKSLVRSYEPEGRTGERRYGLYESIRAYAAERLVESGRREAIQRAHGAYFLDAYGGPRPRALARGDVRFRRSLALDTANLEAIRERATDARPRTSETAATEMEALIALAPISMTRGPLDRYVQLLSRALERSEALPLDPSLRGRVHALLGRMLHIRGQHVEARNELLRAVVLATEAGDLATRTLALGKLGCVEAFRCNWQEGQAHFDDALNHLAHERAPARVRAQLLRDRAFFFARQGKTHDARRDLEESLDLFREDGARRDEGLVLSELAGRLVELGGFESATDHCEKALAISRELGDRRLEASVSIHAGVVAHEQGAFERARASFDQSLATALQIGDRFLQAIAHHHLGNVALMTGRWERAREHLDLAEIIYRANHDMGHAGLRLAAKAVAVAHLGEDPIPLFEQADQLDGAAGRSDAEAIALFRCHLDVVTARAALANGDEARGRLLLERLRAMLTDADAEAARSSSEWCFARKLLAQQLDKVPSRFLLVDSNGAWFELRSARNERNELGRRTALRNLLLALVRQHRTALGTPLTIDELFRFGWPGEDARTDSASNRTNVALTALRKTGLRDVLQTHEGGYRLDPDVGVVIAPAPENIKAH
jgi:predicted ATPase/Tfp pilus assembly protein PilF